MTRRAGFTLVEVIIVVAIFAVVLSIAYGVLITTIDADRMIREETQGGKIGEAILTQIRRDLQGTVYHNLGQQVFFAVDQGDEDSAEDTLDFLTTSPVPMPDESEERWIQELEARGVASVGYVLGSAKGQEGATLFRRVKWDVQDQPWDGERHYPIYNRVKAISFRFLDRDGWLDNWDSQERIPEEEEEEEDDITAITEPTITPNSELEEDEEEEPLPIPLAVEVQLYIYLGDEDGLLKGANGEPVVEKYTAVVPLLTVERLDIDEDLVANQNDPNAGAGGGGGGGGGGAGDGGGSGGGGGPTSRGDG